MIKTDRWVNEEKRLIVRQGDKRKYLIARWRYKGVYRITETLKSGYRTMKEAIAGSRKD